MSAFMFATGIENSYPTIRLPDGTRQRVDEFEKTGHYARWREDFALVKEVGIEFLRYGPPYYRVHTGPQQYDWTFTDETFSALQELGITPIVDLLHFGLPDWLGDFQNPAFPAHFATYAGDFAARFPALQFYTPINEIFVTAMFSARYGWWNECLASDQAFVTALKHLCRANVLAMQAILAVQPGATFIQSESAEYFHPETPTTRQQANLLNQQRFLSLDLTYGYPVSVAMYEYLRQNGLTDADYHWFANQDIKANCIMGTDYYRTNEHIVREDGSTYPAGDVFGYYLLARQYFARYRMPLMHTETNRWEPDAVDWLWRQWANAYRLKQDGIPLVGFTWYSLLDQVDWDSALRENNGRVNPLGMYDLDRRQRPVGRAYQRLIAQWKDVLRDESYGVHINY